LLAGFICLVASVATGQTSDLVSKNSFRVCADPANAPFSMQDGSGFENKIADLMGEALDLPVRYSWFPMATGFVRKTLRENRCDVIIGYAQGHELVLNTNHYYTSVYTMLTPKDSDLADVDMISDPRLKGRPLGVVAGSPPASHLARHGLIADATGYNLMVDRRIENPIGQMVDDMIAGKTDAVFLWGPLAGWYAKENDLNMTPLLKETLPPRLFFRITMGVRQGEVVWKRKLNALIRRNQDKIDDILLSYGVPLVEDMGGSLKEITR
jgi:quinoprotein dehydrogenase-associated probable ABC transporter substrate-binding protein